MATITVLVSTYNWPAALELCLLSLTQQSHLPDEIVVCDDGSKPVTGDLIKRFSESTTIPVVHVWQPDDGFQLSKARNKGIAAATGDYIIQVDGDLILHKHFVKDHFRFKKRSAFTTGSRVMLSEYSTQKVFDAVSTDIKQHSKGNRNYLNSLRVPMLTNFLSSRYKTRGRNKYYVKGCNMAFWREDLLKVNGYNEAFFGWGREDSEIAIRLMNSGIEKRFLKLGGVCYHLHHKEASRAMESANVKMMEDAIKNKTTRAELGVDQYL